MVAGLCCVLYARLSKHERSCFGASYRFLMLGSLVSYVWLVSGKEKANTTLSNT